MRNYTYDKEFMMKVYPTLKKLNLTHEETYTLYNTFWAEEATMRDRFHHHERSFEAFNHQTWKKASSTDKGYEAAESDYDAARNDYACIFDDDDDERRGEKKKRKDDFALSYVQRADDAFRLNQDSPLYEIYLSLTNRQRRIVTMLCRNMTQASIAVQIGISTPAVNGHIKRIRERFMPYAKKNHLLEVKNQAT